MGNSKSKSSNKFNKNHISKKGFQFGVSFGKESLAMEGNIQIGWTNKTVKNYILVSGSEFVEPKDVVERVVKDVVERVVKPEIKDVGKVFKEKDLSENGKDVAKPEIKDVGENVDENVEKDE